MTFESLRTDRLLPRPMRPSDAERWMITVADPDDTVMLGDLVVHIDQCREWGDATLLTSWVPGKGSPEPMYLAHGFVPTGEIDDGDRRTVDAAPRPARTGPAHNVRV